MKKKFRTFGDLFNGHMDFYEFSEELSRAVYGYGYGSGSSSGSGYEDGTGNGDGAENGVGNGTEYCDGHG